MKYRHDNLQGLEAARKSIKNALRDLYAIKGRGRTDVDHLLEEGEAIVSSIDEAMEHLSKEEDDE